MKDLGPSSSRSAGAARSQPVTERQSVPALCCDEEVWHPVHDSEGRYEVSNLGRVRRAKRVKGSRLAEIVRPSIHTMYGYAFLHTRINYASYRRPIHKLVAEAFIGPRPAGCQIAHLNGERTDNRLENLAYVTPAENTSHKWRHGTMLRGEKSGVAKLTEAQAAQIKFGSEPYVATAAKHGVSTHCVKHIRTGSSWAHLVQCDLCEAPFALPEHIREQGEILGLLVCSACVEDQLEARTCERLTA